MSVLPNPKRSILTNITDDAGQIYSYIKTLNQWIQTGADYDHTLVSYNNNGLVSPEIISELEKVKRASEAGLFTGVKPLPNTAAYWYYLSDIDGYIEIHVNEAQDIRADINTNKLMRLIMSRSWCRGSPGEKGLTGLNGLNGLTGPREHTFIAEVDHKVLVIKADVPTPLDTPISVRLYEATHLLGEIRVDLGTGGLSFIYPTNGTLKLDEDKCHLELKDGELAGELHNTIDWIEPVHYKARQVGPAGLNGADGNGFLSVTDTSLSDPTIRADVAAKVLRRGQRADVHFITAAIGTFIPALHLRNNQDTSFIILSPQIKLSDNINPDRWASVEPSISPSKGLMRWSLQGIDDPAKITDPRTGQLNDIVLDLPSWTPMKVVGYGGWSTFNQDIESQCCREDLFLCLPPLEPPACDDDNNGGGAGDRAYMPVDLVPDSGDGDTARFTYTMFDKGGNLLGTGALPEWTLEPNVIVTAADRGTAYFKDGEWQLYQADEVPDDTDCPIVDQCDMTFDDGGHNEGLDRDVDLPEGKRIRVAWQFYSIPDRFIITNSAAAVILDTGCVNGSGWIEFDVEGTDPYHFQVIGACAGGSTTWTVQVSCISAVTGDAPSGPEHISVGDPWVRTASETTEYEVYLTPSVRLSWDLGAPGAENFRIIITDVYLGLVYDTTCLTSAGNATITPSGSGLHTVQIVACPGAVGSWIATIEAL